ncbi:MAG: hypothetical protein AB7O62_04655 [Pirellulales bacterium]
MMQHGAVHDGNSSGAMKYSLKHVFEFVFVLSCILGIARLHSAFRMLCLDLPAAWCIATIYGGVVGIRASRCARCSLSTTRWWGVIGAALGGVLGDLCDCLTDPAPSRSYLKVVEPIAAAIFSAGLSGVIFFRLPAWLFTQEKAPEDLQDHATDL